MISSVLKQLPNKSTNQTYLKLDSDFNEEINSKLLPISLLKIKIYNFFEDEIIINKSKHRMKYCSDVKIKLIKSNIKTLKFSRIYNNSVCIDEDKFDFIVNIIYKETKIMSCKSPNRHKLIKTTKKIINNYY